MSPKMGSEEAGETSHLEESEFFAVVHAVDVLARVGEVLVVGGLSRQKELG